MSTQNPRSADATKPRFHLATGSLYGQVYSGHAKTRSKLGRLHAALAPTGLNLQGANLLVHGHTPGFQNLVRDIKYVGLVLLTPTLPEERHLKGPMLALRLDTSDTRAIFVLDPASPYVRQHYQQWVKAGEVSIAFLPPGGHGASLQTISMEGVDAGLEGWPLRTDWEPDPVKRIWQVVNAFEVSCKWKKTVVTSVLEFQEITAEVTPNPTGLAALLNLLRLSLNGKTQA